MNDQWTMKGLYQPGLVHEGESTARGWRDWPELDPRDFGAATDGEALDTAAIQSAIDAAHERQGGRVVLDGGTFLSGSIFLKPYTAIVIEEGAILRGTTDLQAYPKQAGHMFQNCP
ncbi:MAG: glycosyl hydrolase family 28-related protein, partial [Planctomycetota bacterium]